MKLLEAVVAGVLLVALVAAVVAVSVLVWGWLVMVVLGVAHGEFGWPAHGVGFGPCVLLGLLPAAIQSALTRRARAA